MAPRLKVVQPQQCDNRRRKRLPSPNATPKAKAKTQPKPDHLGPSEATMKFQESWAKKIPDGRGICIRFNTGKCRSGKTCRYAHVCPIRNAKGEPCAGAHRASKHKGAPHCPVPGILLATEGGPYEFNSGGVTPEAVGVGDLSASTDPPLPIYRQPGESCKPCFFLDISPPAR